MTKPEFIGVSLPTDIGWWRNEFRVLYVIRGYTDFVEVYDRGPARLISGKYYRPFSCVEEADHYVIPK